MLYKKIKEAWKNPKKNINELFRTRLIEWRKQNTIIRIKRPTRLDRARNLGYRAKQGIILVRVRVKSGGRQRPRPTKKGRRSKRQTSRKLVGITYQQIAEQRANKKYVNCEVLNSYYVGKDGKSQWYEIILIDRDHPQIKKDKKLSAVAKQKGRVYRGLTSVGKRSRGILTHKGKGAEKLRPSRRKHMVRTKQSRTPHPPKKT